MAEEQNNQEKAKAPAEKKPPAAKAKKEKPPKLEDKPFDEFIQQHYLPALKEAMAGEGIDDVDLAFVQQGVPIKGANSNELCWQVIGKWDNGDRLFNIYFPDEDIAGQKAFSSATYNNPPSTLESFMIDERRVNLELLVMYTIQRLNAQKWLTRN
ncbi:DUF2996 domain-containing protein [Waterburya agarophytonicola K14]|uniref:DUF2996 domain-containing protein n=1 Tax=Waterburya agarophytonicola KI4 TaxID=2874699 RepID=A0A964FHT4_9CYAN|nr:DUF2996 domain-containing protein [Waterburya agarophytonicola]MCC0177884.1 DUF2996 domain-containing protein [Waterburya agarophytonicola KI4]